MTTAPLDPAACRHIGCRDRYDPVAWAWDGLRWSRYCGAHLAGLARVADPGVYTVDWDTPVDGPAPSLPGPVRKVEADPSDTPPPAPAVHAAREPVGAVSLPLELPCPSSSSPSSVAVSPSAPAPSGSDPVASSGPAAERSSSPSADPRPKRVPGGSKPKYPPVTRRVDDAPGLCLNDACTSPPKSRGLCVRCFDRARRQGVLDAVALPGMSPREIGLRGATAAWSKRSAPPPHTPKSLEPTVKNSALPPLTLRPNPDTTPSLCRIAGCGGLVKARGFCARCAERVRVAGRLDELGLPPRPAGRPRTAPRPDPEAKDPLQQIRVILGCDPDGADQEVVDKARSFVQFRDAVESAVNAAGIPGFMLLEDLVNAVSGIAGERDRARDEAAEARAELDAYRSRGVPPTVAEPATGGLALSAREVRALLAITDCPAPHNVRSAVRALLGVPDGR